MAGYVKRGRKALSFVAGFALGCVAASAWHALNLSSPLPTAGLRPAPNAGSPPAALAPTPSCPELAAQLRLASVGQSSSPTPSTPEELLERVLTHPEDESVPPFSRAVENLKDDPAARAELLARYATEADPGVRSRIRALLGFIPSPDVAAAGIRMGGAKDATVRREGFQLLNGAQVTSQEARDLLLEAVSTERDPQALSAAIASLVPGSWEAPQEVSRVLERLRKTAADPSPEVRAESLLARSRWGATESAEEIIYMGFNDPQDSVREAAMDALFEHPVRSDRLKAVLLAVASGDTQGPATRLRAVEALGTFPLSQEEHAALADMRNRLSAAQ